MTEPMKGLKAILAIRGMKLVDLSVKINVGYSTLASYTGGFRQAPEYVIASICNELGITEQDLYKVPELKSDGEE
jgi:hypothetical protein